MNKALLVGLSNYPNKVDNIDGSVEDVKAWHSILEYKYRFVRDNIHMLTNEKATKNAVMSQLNWLISGASSGDTLVFIYSGHGARFSERVGIGHQDEVKDEALVLYDSKGWGDMLIDDELSLFFRYIPDGANTTVICDSCFSGGMDLMPSQHTATMSSAQVKFSSSFSHATHEDNSDVPVMRFGCGLSKADSIQCAKSRDFSKSRTLLLSACGEEETAASARSDTNGLSVFSYYAIGVLKRSGRLLSACEFVAQTRRDIERAGHSQTPRLIGRRDLFTIPMFT